MNSGATFDLLPDGFSLNLHKTVGGQRDDRAGHVGEFNIE
jgi:hypothetical protein